MTVKLYTHEVSPVGRAAMMACEIFNVPVEYIDIDLSKGEQFNPEYLKKNPLHAIPALEDGDLFIHDSQTIFMYLADAYGKDDSWYPKDVKQRTLVNQKLFFNASIIYTRLWNISYPAFGGNREVSQEKRDALEDTYKLLEEFLSRTKFLAGDHMTIADVASIATLTSYEFIVPLNSEKYPKTRAWINEIEKQPFYRKINEPGASKYKAVLNQILDLSIII